MNTVMGSIANPEVADFDQIEIIRERQMSTYKVTQQNIEFEDTVSGLFHHPFADCSKYKREEWVAPELYSEHKTAFLLLEGQFCIFFTSLLQQSNS